MIPAEQSANSATKDWSALTTAQRIKHLEIEGYLVVPNLLSSEQVEKIKFELDRLPTNPTDYSENQRSHSDVQWTDSPNTIDVIALPAMIDFLTTLFGDELICTSCVFALSRPGHPGIAIHTDAQPMSGGRLPTFRSTFREFRLLKKRCTWEGSFATFSGSQVRNFSDWTRPSRTIGNSQ